MQQLEQLATELRQTIIDTVSRRGGHLAPNLGVVELTLALHSVLDLPRDRLIWDVGHQAYAHKLLTGRRDRFDSLRQRHGISGYPRRCESPYDCFGTGHASTAISAAVGMAVARDLQGEDYNVVAVVGDGALTGGMAYEALNHAGHLRTRLVIVLNDNKMSISPNVGAISHYLNRLRLARHYTRAKGDLLAVARHVPGGVRAYALAERVKGSVKHLLLPGGLFEEMGFTYFGPLDGHNLGQLQEVLREVIRQPGPVLVHVVTKKGKGYLPAEEDPAHFHGTSAFDPANGRPLVPATPSPSPARVALPLPTYSEVFAETLIRLAAGDPRVVAITAAMPEGTGLDRFARVYPRRFFDVGIAEAHAVTFAAGLATAGMRPVAAIYSTFLQRAYDQIIHDVALQKLPVLFCLDRAGLVGEDGATHQGVFDLAYLRIIPNMVVAAPADGRELQGLLRTALKLDGPMAIRYPKGAVPAPWPEDAYSPDRLPEPLPVGRAQVRRNGQDVALLALGPMVARAEQAAERLAAAGIRAAVVNMRFVKPLDEELLHEMACSLPALVTIEEGVTAGGLGSAVIEWLQLAGLRRPVSCLGVPDRFIEHATQEQQREEVGLTVDSIVAAVHQLLAGLPPEDRDGQLRRGRESGAHNPRLDLVRSPETAAGKVVPLPRHTGQVG